MDKVHLLTMIPKKKSKHNPLTAKDKKENREHARLRIAVEHIIRMVKRFRILSEKYRNRRSRFELRFNLIAGINNYELPP